MAESSDTETFDFDAHRQKATEAYQKKRPLYEAFAEVVRSILHESLKTAGINAASVEARAKTIESFGNKAASPAETDPNEPRYRDPVSQITDLSGARVITFFPRTLENVDAIVRSEFAVLEKIDKSDVLRKEERLGYQSIHYVVALRPNRLDLPEYRQFGGLKAEIQIRTILQHAWAEIEHDIQYKSVETIPTAIRRRFMSLAGLLEIADREFQTIQDDDEQLRQQARKSVQAGRLEQVEITADALKSYLDKKLGSDGRMKDYAYQYLARILRQLGFRNFRQIDECIAGYDDDKLSRAVYGTRQGQISRFEYQLMASMGPEYIKRHPNSRFAGWVNWIGDTQRKFEKVGVQLGNYCPPEEQQATQELEEQDGPSQP